MRLAKGLLLLLLLKINVHTVDTVHMVEAYFSYIGVWRVGKTTNVSSTFKSLLIYRKHADSKVQIENVCFITCK